MPHYKHESDHGGRVAGVDEVGRGPLAGPVLAAAVVFPGAVPRLLARTIHDSKVLTSEQRESAYRALRRLPGIEIAVGAACTAEIERLNILHAAMLAMTRAIRRLPRTPDLVLVDGNRLPALPCAGRCIIGGDGISLSIAAASIIAKVTRDRLMARLGSRYPAFGWNQNAGYATAGHRAALLLHGPSVHHRADFRSVRESLLQDRLAAD